MSDAKSDAKADARTGEVRSESWIEAGLRKSPAPASRACGWRCWPRTSA